MQALCIFSLNRTHILTQFANGPGDDFLFEESVYDDVSAQDSGPSLPIILLSAACGLGSGLLAFYISYGLLGWGPQLSAGIATLALLTGLGVVGGGLSVLSGSRAGWINILFSCGVVFLCVLFLGLCVVAGAIVATLILMLGV